MSAPNEMNDGLRRKRPHEETIAGGNGLINGEPTRQEPRLMADDGRNAAMNHLFYSMGASQAQGNYSTNQQAGFFGQAMAHVLGNVQANQGAHNPVPANAFTMQGIALQANQGQAPAGFPANNMTPNQVQNAQSTQFAPQQPAMTMQQAQVQQQPVQNVQAGQIRPFGMEPAELLNYAVIVNILHNSISRGNGNALPNLGHEQLQGGNQQVGNQSMQPALHQQMAVNGNQGFYGANQGAPSAAAALPQECNQLQMMRQPSALPLNQTNVENRNAQFAASYEHTVSPSIPSENNFNTRSVSLPNHVLQVQHIDPKVRCVPLWTNDDESRLSTQQCWLRKQIETFPASERDVRRHTRGRNRILELGQVGIQCIHCKNLPQEGRGKGSSYFPSSTKGIYQAAQNILAYHFKEDTCPIITQQLLQEMREAGSSGIPRHLAPKAGKSRSGGGKSFWEVSAVRTTGLVDTTVGIRYSNDHQNYRPLESVTLGMTESGHNNGSHYCPSESVLVSLADKDVVTDFCFLLMSQFVPYAEGTPKSMSEFSDDVESDLDDDDGRRVGICCRFCKGVTEAGRHREGVFLSIKPSTMMRNKQLTKLHSHIVSCRYAPGDLKRNVINAKEMHLPQSDRLKRGWKKVFFDNLCQRLKQALDSGGETSETSGATYV